MTATLLDDPYTVGIDVSYAQGEIDWAAVREAGGVAFAYVKATEGETLVDEQFHRNWAVLRERAPLLRGAYHYFVFRDDPIVQARTFLSAAAPVAGDLMPMIDVEESDEAMDVDERVKRLGAFTDFVERTIGRRMLLYTNLGFWESVMAQSDAFAGHPLWIAQYSDASEPVLPAAWKTWALWQFADTGSFSGISGAVDVNRFNGSLDRLSTYRL